MILLYCCSAYGYHINVWVCILISIDNGELQIWFSKGGKNLASDRGSGDWGTICKDGFDDDAGDVACKQLGYVQFSDVYTYT